MAKLRYVFDAVREIKRALDGRRAADRIRRQSVHARLLHDRRRAAAPTSRTVRRMAYGRPDLLQRLVERQRAGGRRVSQRADRARRRRGDDLRHLGRTAFARGVPDVLARADARGARGAAAGAGRSRRADDRLHQGRRAVARRRSPRAARRRSGSTGPSISRGARRASARASRCRATSIRWCCSPIPTSSGAKPAAIVRAAGPAPGHIFNLGHGIVPGDAAGECRRARRGRAPRIARDPRQRLIRAGSPSGKQREPASSAGSRPLDKGPIVRSRRLLMHMCRPDLPGARPRRDRLREPIF